MLSAAAETPTQPDWTVVIRLSDDKWAFRQILTMRRHLRRRARQGR